MRKKNIIILTLTIIISLLFSSCFLQKETVTEPKPEPFSKEKANEAAVTYLKEKYGEEFTVVEGNLMRSDMYSGGDLWYEVYVIKKENENKDNPHKYMIKISYEDDGSYIVYMNEVIYGYYQQLYYDFAAPIIAKQMDNIPYELVVMVSKDKNKFLSSEIPKSFDDEKCGLSKTEFSFEIFIPQSYDSENISDICQKIKNSLGEENYNQAYIDVLSDDQFDDLAASDDKYWKCVVNNYFDSKNYYEVE